MRIVKYLLFVGLILLCVSAFSQEKGTKHRKKMLAKQEVQKEKAKEKAIEEGKERHMNIQTKAVKKRMKQQAKKSKKVNRQRSGKKKSFFGRIFTGKD